MNIGCPLAKRQTRYQVGRIILLDQQVVCTVRYKTCKTKVNDSDLGDIYTQNERAMCMTIDDDRRLTMIDSTRKRIIEHA